MEGSSSLVMSALDTEIRRGTWTYGGGHGNTRGSTGMAHWPFPASWLRSLGFRVRGSWLYSWPQILPAE